LSQASGARDALAVGALAIGVAFGRRRRRSRANGAGDRRD
jgi:MYXO-CTERM domain-containing protein